MDTMRNLSRLVKLGKRALVSAALCALTMPALASADGLPRLDPTNGGSGTAYSFKMTGATKSMDPALQGGTISWNGGLLLYQNGGSAALQADMDLDTNKDGIPDRTLACDGIVGSMRVSMRCTRNDGLNELRLMLTGRAIILDNGNLALRQASGRGYTDTHTFMFSFQATQAVP